MRIWLSICSLAALASAGCLHTRNEQPVFSPISLSDEETNAVQTASVPPSPRPAPAPDSVKAAVPSNPTTTPTATPAPPASNRAANEPAPSRAPTTTATQPPPTTAAKPIVTAAEGLAGKIASVNTAAKFVVLNFPIGQMPAFDQILNVYRKGLKVAEVKVTGPKQDDLIVADLSQGSAAVGDDVRDR